MSFDFHAHHHGKFGQNILLQQQQQIQKKQQQPVYLNFHETVEVGKSSFAVSVPRSWSTIQLPSGETLRREFKFTELNITPGFYSQRASVLGVDSDSNIEVIDENEELALPFAVGYDCLESLYFDEKINGVLAESHFDAGVSDATLQEFVTAFNAKFASKIPAGFTSPPVFLDWVDLNWYTAAVGTPDRVQQVAHSSADQTHTLAVDPAANVGFFREAYYGIGETDELEPFGDALPASVRKMTGVNNYLLPTNVTNDIRIRIHIAPNTTLSFSANFHLESLGFVSVFRRGEKRRIHLPNSTPLGNNYKVLTGQRVPLARIIKTPGKVYVKPSKLSHRFADGIVNFPAGSFSENWPVNRAVSAALDSYLMKTGVSFPKLRYNSELSKFRFEYPPNDRLSFFVECDPRLSERLGFGPLAKVTPRVVSSVMRDGTSKIEAEILAKALVFDAGMCLVTLDETYSNDTYGLDDFSMTTLWPTDSGTFHMSDKFSRSAFLPSVISSNLQNLIELTFSVSTLASKSVRMPLNWPVSFCVEGTLEGNV